jgi:hypothetical protein
MVYVVHDPLEQLRSWVCTPDAPEADELPIVKLVFETILSNSVDLHLGQATALSSSEDIIITSKNSSHFKHLNSYMGIVTPLS